MLRRAYELALISSDEFFSRYQGLLRFIEKKKKKGKGGPPDYLFNVAVRHSTKPSEEYQNFEKLAKQLISVPKSEIDKRETEYQRQKKAGKKRRTA